MTILRLFLSSFGILIHLKKCSMLDIFRLKKCFNFILFA